MIPGVVAFRRQSAGPALQHLVFPLTYDEMDSDNVLSLTRLGPAAPLVTPFGFEGDGYAARLLCSALPSWVAPDLPLTIHGSADIRPCRIASLTEDQVLFGLTTNTVNAWPYMAFYQGNTDQFPMGNTIKFGIYDGLTTTLVPLGRAAWHYGGPVPELSISGNPVRPQAILILDDDTLIVSVHASDTESVVYKLRISDWELLGQFTFGTSTYRHVAAFARRGNGDIWACDYETGKLLRLDLDASFGAGTASILQVVDSSSLTGISAIEFATISGTEYLLTGQYVTADAGGYVALFPATALSGSTLVEGDRYKRFLLGRRMQGIALRAGNLLVARNSIYGSSTTAGYVERYDITGMAGSLADGATVNASTNPSYLLSTRHAPSGYPEDIAVHPTTQRVFIPTEGSASVGDYPGFLGVWSGTLDQYAVETYHLTAYHDGVQGMQINVNGHAFATLADAEPFYNPNILCIGGKPSAVSAGFSSGFTYSYVRNVLLQSQSLSDADYALITSGAYEASTLTAYTLTLVNPGAETGDTTGWTNETGTLTARNFVTRVPPQGTWYFDGGSNAIVVARQRLDLVAQGVDTGDLDSGAAWAKIGWYQAAFDNNDPGGMGIRTLNASQATIATTYSPTGYTPGGTGAPPYYWFPRNFPVAIAANTRYLDALYNASGRTGGTNNDHYVDEVSVTVYAP